MSQTFRPFGVAPVMAPAPVVAPKVIIQDWDDFAPVEPRFGFINEIGEHTVQIVDVQKIMASQSFKLLDDRTIGPRENKSPFKFDLAFDQQILAVVFQDELGRVRIDRRSRIGWIHSDDDIVTPEFIQYYGLSPAKDGYRYYNVDGSGLQSEDRSKGCASRSSKLFKAADAVKWPDLLGKVINILIGEKKGSDDEDGNNNTEIVAFYPRRAITSAPVAATHIVKPAVANERPGPLAGIVESSDLPF